RTTVLLALLCLLGLTGTAQAVVPHDVLPRPALSAGVVVAPQVVQPQGSLLRFGSASDNELSLADRVRAALSRSSAVTVSAAVDVDGLGQVLRTDSGHALPPASTQKSYVATAALLALPEKYRWTTEVAARTTPTAGRLPGGLWLVAGGDPYLSKLGLRGLARSVRASGITYVTGDLLLDDSRYDNQRRVSGWKTEYVPEQSGPLSALVVDRNTWRRDRAFLADPAVPIAALFRDYLQAEGVVVHGVIRRNRRPADARSVATTQSGPVADVVRRILKNSDNFAAELLLKEVGRKVSGTGTSAAGMTGVRSVLSARGVPVGVGSDGSGLSSQDRQTTGGQLLLLQAAAADAAAAGPELLRALPLACRDGTLKTRMCNSAASGRLSAKTGTLPGIRSLVGYTTTASGRSVQFAFQLTGVQDGIAARDAMDAAAIVLASATE
ncbi:MAG: D-alanyl-D-alanine carboxypeptidase/D-alanyl-D-alanine-endopeptidase, partial [Mycobacteriales bacterium]